MAKNISALAAVIVIIVLGVLFWALRGRPAGEDTTSATASPRLESPAATATAPGPVSVSESETVVGITDEGFAPSAVSVAVGGTVTFRNDDAVPHQVASSPHPVHTDYPPLNGPVLNPGESHSVVFTPAGTYQYHDHLNPGLTGTVTVPK